VSRERRIPTVFSGEEREDGQSKQGEGERKRANNMLKTSLSLFSPVSILFCQHHQQFPLLSFSPSSSFYLQSAPVVSGEIVEEEGKLRAKYGI